MNELTKEQQDIIEKAAARNCVCDHDCSHKSSFNRGVTFALASPDLMRGVLEEFAEWIRTFEALERQNGQWVIESQLSDKDIVKAFIEDIKQKEVTYQQIIQKANESPALKEQSKEAGTFAYPKRFEGKVPLKVKTILNVYPDMPFLAKEDTFCEEGKEYYCWVNSYGAVSAICPNGEQLGLKPHEFIVTEYH